MEEHNDAAPDSSPEIVDLPQAEAPVREDVKPPTPVAPKEKTVPYERFKDVNDELNRLKSQPPPKETKSLDVEDIVNISASLEGLDQREKEKLAKEHQLTGRPLSEIRKDEDFTLWQDAYRTKVEKEKLALKPSGTQADAERPKTFVEKLRTSSMADKEKFLTEVGLYKSPRPRTDRTNIGPR
jgi:hypothetical protein